MTLTSKLISKTNKPNENLRYYSALQSSAISKSNIMVTLTKGDSCLKITYIEIS
jgi:hypothetical protein